MPILKPKIADLSEQVVDILNRHLALRSLSEFEKARLEKLITEIGKLYPAFGHSFRGGYLGLLGNAENAIREHQTAISMEPDNPILLTNYGATLLKMGHYQEAYDIHMEAMSRFKPDKDTLEGAINAAYFLDSDTLPSLLEQYRKITGHHHEAEQWTLEDKDDEADIDSLVAESKTGPHISLKDLCGKLGL